MSGAGFVKSGVLLALAGTLGFQLMKSREPTPPDNTEAVGRPVPDLEVAALATGQLRDLRALSGSGCGHVYFMDPDCAACRNALAPDAGERRAPVAPLPGSDFHIWISLNPDSAKNRAFSQEFRLPVDQIYSISRSTRARLAVSSTPVLWKVSEGVVVTYSEGVGNTSTATMLRNPHFLCEAL